MMMIRNVTKYDNCLGIEGGEWVLGKGTEAIGWDDVEDVWYGNALQ